MGLTGNPNVGKSTLFNALTGARQHVGNWPGKTVEKKEGRFDFNDKKIKVIDLPGSYSLTAYTEEETITSDFILEEKPNIIIQIIDSQNLVRNLFMTVQLMELGRPLVIALNMVDLLAEKGISIDVKKISNLLDVPIVVIDARNKIGIDELMTIAFKTSKRNRKSSIKLGYGVEMDDELKKIQKFIKNKEKNNFCRTNWLSLKLIEGDYRVQRDLTKKAYYFELRNELQKSINHLRDIYDKDINTILTDARYGFIRGIEKEVISKKRERKRKSFAEKFDSVAMNKFFGVPYFLLMMFLVFQATFKISAPMVGWIEGLFRILSEEFSVFLMKWGASDWLISLFSDAIIGGVGGVLAFVPLLGILFLFIALMEDIGYMSRVAYIMDKFMHKIGLHGKAFIPLILGFGCNVPGIMATRILENKRDRLLTILISPFISCGAKLPVYALFVGVFFSNHQGIVIFSIYIFGISVAIMAGLIFKKVLFKKLSSPFVIELPSYRMPTIKGVIIHVWEKVWSFIKKAGTIILFFSIVIWALASFPVGVEYASSESLVGIIGQKISPIFRPLGFDNWQASVALIFGFVAKEIIVGTLGTLYNVVDVGGDTGNSLSVALQGDYTPLAAYAFMIFVLLYVPCMAVLATVKKETNSWRWPLFMASYTIIIAWIFAFIIYQGGRILGFS